MYKFKRAMFTAVCTAGVLAAAGAMTALAQSPTVVAGSQTAVSDIAGPAGAGQQEQVMESIRIWGPVLGVENGSIRIDNQSGASFEGEMVLHIAEGETLVLDAVDGFPMSLSDIQVGETVYAYIGPAMTMSLPPQTTATMVVAGVPADFKAPELVTVDSMTWNEDTSWTLVSTDGTTFHIPGETPIVPYRTRQFVSLADVTEGRQLLVWSDADNNGTKLVLFNE